MAQNLSEPLVETAASAARDVQPKAPYPSVSQVGQKACRHKTLSKLRGMLDWTERRFATPAAVARADIFTPSSPAASKAAAIENQAQERPGIWATGCANIDIHLPRVTPNAGEKTTSLDDPRGMLDPSGVHEITGVTYRDQPAACAFALALLARLTQASSHVDHAAILWCQAARDAGEFGRLYARGLDGFAPRRAHQGGWAPNLICVEAATVRDVLWAVEEGARTPGLTAIMAQVGHVSFTESRRLALAAATGGTAVLLLRPHDDHAATAAATRWRIAAARSRPCLLSKAAPGNPCWSVALERSRGGRPGRWRVEWTHETHRLDLVEEFSSRHAGVVSPPQSDADSPRIIRLAA
ncbi:MAG: hypothetical protein AAGJ70_09355 [Pseudomonadota bacterium]